MTLMLVNLWPHFEKRGRKEGSRGTNPMAKGTPYYYMFVYLKKKQKPKAQDVEL